MRDTKWRDGIYGLITGDALGVPVEFVTRQALAANPVKGMREYGTHSQPAGTWSDDSSMVLATLASYVETGSIDFVDIMQRYLNWIKYGEYTPFHDTFDNGLTVERALERFESGIAPLECGGNTEYDNGNGSLMRILPFCLYAVEKNYTEEKAIRLIHDASRLTHRHKRSLIGCGLFLYCVMSLLGCIREQREEMLEVSIDSSGELKDRLKSGIRHGLEYYGKQEEYSEEAAHYSRLADFDAFVRLDESQISSSGYVVDTLEAVLWCLSNSDSYETAVLKAVNLGDDSDTVGALTGALAGMFYGYESIPKNWIDKLKRREFIEEILREI